MRTADELANHYERSATLIREAGAAYPDNVFSGVSALWTEYFADRSTEDAFGAALSMLSDRTKASTGVAPKIAPDYYPIYQALYESVFSPEEVPVPTTFGDPDLLSVHGIPTSLSHLQNQVRSRDILSLWRQRLGRPVRVLEVGSGYGGMAEQLIRAGIAETYTIVDLPENLLLASFYLYAHCDRPIAVGHLSDAQDGLSFLLPQQVAAIAAHQFDIIINCDSLGEMPASAATAYVELFSGLLSEDGFFYSKNGHRRSDGTVQRITDYGYEKFSLLRFGYNPVPSLIFDHHGHIAVFGRDRPGARRLIGQDFEIASEMFRSGLQADLDSMLSRLTSGHMDAADRDLLAQAGALYYDRNLPTSDSPPLVYLRGIELFLRGRRRESAEALRQYLAEVRSPLAEAISWFTLLQAGVALPATYRNGAQTRFFLGTMKLRLDRPISRALLFAVRRANLEGITRPFGGGRTPVAVRLKNLLMNLREGKGPSTVRRAQGIVRPELAG